MQSLKYSHFNKNTDDSEPTTSQESLYSGYVTKALATSVDSLDPTNTSFDGKYLTFTSSKLQNGQLKPKNFARDMAMPRNCLVCGNPTKYCHYGVSSCNGCKTFFRRSLLESKTYTCQLNGMCSNMNGIDGCRACRFDRCIFVGMNPRSIQFPTSVDVAKFSDKVSNRKRYLSQKYGERCPVLIRKTGPMFEETIEDKIIQSLVYVELKVKKIRESSRWPHESVKCRSIRELLDSNNENVLAHADQYPKELKWPFTRASDFDEDFKFVIKEGRSNWIILDMFLCIEMVRRHIDTSCERNSPAAISCCFQAAPIRFHRWEDNNITMKLSFAFIVFLHHGYMARTMPVFSQLDYNDQETEVYRLEGIKDMIQLFSYRTMLAISRIQMTMEEFVLLKAIIYSHSAIHGLSERGRVLLHKESIRYAKTLMKHLKSRMGAAPGAKKYVELVSFVGVLFHGAQRLREVHVYMANVMRLPHCSTPYIETIMYA